MENKEITWIPYKLIEEFNTYKESLVFKQSDYEIRKNELMRENSYSNKKKNYDETLPSYIETKKFLESKDFYNLTSNYFGAYIERVGYRLNITFELTTPHPQYCCAFNVEYCDCQTACCGKKTESFIIDKLSFDAEINKIIKLQEE